MSQTLCDAVAKVLQKCLQVQCWHEYGFLGDQFNERATFVSETFDPLIFILKTRANAQIDTSKLDAHVTT